MRLSLTTPAATMAVGAALARLAAPTDALLLHGTYGAGKTCLARGFVRAYVNDPLLHVASPSYLIDLTYDDETGRRQPAATLHHIDLWRLPEGKVSGLVDLDNVFSTCVSLIEWPERLLESELPAARLDVHLSLLNDTSEWAEEQPREVLLVPQCAEWARRLDEAERSGELEAAAATSDTLS